VVVQRFGDLVQAAVGLAHAGEYGGVLPGVVGVQSLAAAFEPGQGVVPAARGQVCLADGALGPSPSSIAEAVEQLPGAFQCLVGASLESVSFSDADQGQRLKAAVSKTLEHFQRLGVPTYRFGQVAEEGVDSADSSARYRFPAGVAALLEQREHLLVGVESFAPPAGDGVNHAQATQGLGLAAPVTQVAEGLQALAEVDGRGAALSGGGERAAQAKGRVGDQAAVAELLEQLQRRLIVARGLAPATQIPENIAETEQGAALAAAVAEPTVEVHSPRSEGLSHNRTCTISIAETVHSG